MSTSKYKITFIRDSYIRFYNQHKKEIDKAISDCLAKGNVIMEQQVQEFEKKFAKFCEKKYCVTLRSGTDALLLAGRIRKPDLMQKYRYKLSFSAKSVEMKEGAINLMDLEDKVKKNDCLLITYMNSVQPNLKELEVIKKKYNLFIIEDACQSIGKKLIGDISCFSLYPAKMLCLEDEKWRSIRWRLISRGSNSTAQRAPVYAYQKKKTKTKKPALS